MAEAPRVAVIHALHDGVQSMQTGVGRVAMNVVATFNQVRHTAIPNACVSLHLITTEYPHESPAYSLALERRSLAAVEAYGGTLTTVSTPPGCRTAREVWGGPDRWRRAGAEAFDVAMGIAERYDRTLIFAHDIVFASLLNQLHRASGKHLRFTWVPHSTARIHRYGSLDREREEIEFAVAASINHDSRAYAGAIGRFMAQHLETEFGIERKRIVPFKNGLVIDSEAYPSMNLNESTELLRRVGVPDGVPLVLFWGRAVPHKGIDLLIEAWERVRSHAHLLMVAPTETGSPGDELTLSQAVRALGSSATAVFRFDPLLPFAALSHPSTTVVVIPSRSEPCSLTAMEAKWYSRTGAFVILMSAVDGLVEQAVSNGTREVGLDPEMLAQSIDAALRLPAAERREMAGRAFTSLSGWDFAVNHSRGMEVLWADISENMV